jgi:hypothetical protein
MQLRIRICGSRSSICNSDKTLPENVIEHITLKCSLLREYLIDNISGVDLALITGHLCCDVVLHYGC